MNGTIPSRFTCDGLGNSPELVFSNLPEDTKSLALTMEDPDTKRLGLGGVWDHWVLWNISPCGTRITEGAVPSGVVGENTAGQSTYFGPCPPRGGDEHHYVFTLYAVDSEISLAEGSTKKELLQKLSGHVIERAQLIGRYRRA